MLGRIPWNKDKKMSDEQKEKLRQINLGKTHSTETKEKMSRARKGFKVSEETSKKMSQRQIGEKNCNYGKFWWTDGTNNVLAKICPAGFSKGKTLQWKTNAVFDGDKWIDVNKDPITDSGKRSKPGILSVVKDRDNKIITIRRDNLMSDTDLLAPVFKDGDIIKNYTFSEVRANAKIN